MGIILASGSPRRQELLQYAVKDYRVIPAKTDEILPESIASDRSAEYLAVQKAEAVSSEYPDDVVIGCDTVVLLDNEVMGKPHNKDDARRMLLLLSGRTHIVITGVCLKKGNRQESFSVVTEVEFFPLSESDIDEYIETGEPMDKAGAYGIQGKGSVLVRQIHGDFFNVMGLPVSILKRKIDDFIR